MNQDILRTPLTFLILLVSLIYVNHSLSAETDGGPIIQIDKTAYTFPPVFEGEELSYAFTVFNKGNTELRIEKVTHA